tara:strand:+ start:5518 stop:5880 length:363 start_codon:yes stop_codon:yes gene_type:complete
MKVNKITAIFDEYRLKDVEGALLKHSVTGFTLYPVSGRGHYFDSYNKDHLIKHIKMEIYTNAEKAADIANLIVDAAHVNAEGEGLVCIDHVQELIWIHEKRSALEADFGYRSEDISGDIL